MRRPILKLTGIGPMPTPHDIVALERDIGAPLPDDYKAFLLTSNGGVPEPAMGFVWKQAVQKINAFWTLLPTPLDGLRNAFWELRELNVDGLLPIAGSEVGRICLDLRDRHGAVMLAEAIRSDDVLVRVHVQPLADCFSKFAECLVKVSPWREEGEKGVEMGSRNGE